MHRSESLKDPIISVSGLRGIIGESLSPQVAMDFVTAFVAGLEPGPIVVTRDGRATGPMLADAIRSALVAAGRIVLDGDVAATPTTGVLVRDHDAVGGVQISASHNPPEYNGLKLFGRDGCVLNAGQGEQVIARYRDGGSILASYDKLGQVTRLDQPHGGHLQSVVATVDAERIRARNFRVLLDSNHGAGSLLGRMLLESLNCDVTLLGGETDGQFAHPPEPTAENLAGVCQQVTSCGAAIGFCQDPDADRLAVINENGHYVGEEYTLALCFEHRLSQKRGPIVTNCATSRMSQDLAAKYDVPYHMSAVGEANVVQCMREHDAVFGGEGNGGPIDPRVGYVRDSFVGMAQILDLLAERDQPVSTLVDELPRYAIHKTKISLDTGKLPAVNEALGTHFADAQQNTMDGLRLDWPDRWLLVRGSNTEPIVRLIAEATSDEIAIDLCRQAAGIASRC